MKPVHVLEFIVSVLIGIGILMFVFPKKGIKISNKFTLQFVSWHDFLNPIRNKDITKIIKNNKIDEKDSIEESPNAPKEVFDSVYIDSVLVVYKVVKINIDSTLQTIDYPKNNDTLLYGFFRQLGTLKSSGKKIHILHYGDSQIEEDRMTSYFRYRLQKTFGGFGAGFIPGIQAFNFTEPMLVSYSDNWYRYTLFPHKDSLVKHRRFGLTTMFSRFKAINDSSVQQKSAWIQFEKSPTAFSTTRRYSLVKLFYGYNKTDVKLNIYDNGKLFAQDNLLSNKRLHIKKWNFTQTPKTLKFEYIGNSSPEIYGYSFESRRGVIVDNLSVRGSSGLFFGRMNLNLLGQIIRNLNVKLILLQFGGNAVGKDSANIRKYVKYFGAQIGYLHAIAPYAKIIVLGPADMSEKYKNNYVTRKKLPFLIALLKEEALKRNCCFWNMYEAMGGANSMPSWVFHNPPLAEKDFVHFSPQGANIIAKMFYKALIFDYNRFLKQQITK